MINRELMVAGDTVAVRSIDRAVDELVALADDVDKLVEASGDKRLPWQQRAAAVRLLAERHLPDVTAAGAIAAATHDEVDWVAFTAIQTIGAFKIRSALVDLIKISGWPSNFTRPRYGRKPVGCGAAFAKRAMLDIFGSTDPATLRRLEDEHFAAELESMRTGRRPRNNPDTVLIPAGPFIAGSTAAEIGPFQMNDTDNPLRVVDLPAYRIDRTTVTNAQYAQFLEQIAGSAEFDHPDQQSDRRHIPSHWHDPRFNRPEFPVVGIDWYDAWAFAKWAGGLLPSEEQWEKAARGTDGRVFPWGNDFDSARVNYVERSYATAVSDLGELESLLVTTNEYDHPAEPVLPADCLPEGASPYGVLQMSGNVWELTRTNFFTRADMDPFFKGRRPVEFMNRKDAFHVLRGGTWTSPPICLTTYYRGKDLLTDLHNEVGFRCVYPVDA